MKGLATEVKESPGECDLGLCIASCICLAIIPAVGFLAQSGRDVYQAKDWKERGKKLAWMVIAGAGGGAVAYVAAPAIPTTIYLKTLAGTFIGGLTSWGMYNVKNVPCPRGNKKPGGNKLELQKPLLEQKPEDPPAYSDATSLDIQEQITPSPLGSIALTSVQEESNSPGCN